MSKQEGTTGKPKENVYSTNQTGGITVGEIQADNIAGGNIEKIIKVINQDSSMKDILRLMEKMKAEIEIMEVSDEEKEKANECIDNAMTKVKTDKSDKKSIRENLENAGKILEGVSKVLLYSG